VCEHEQLMSTVAIERCVTPDGDLQRVWLHAQASCAECGESFLFPRLVASEDGTRDFALELSVPLMTVLELEAWAIAGRST